MPITSLEEYLLKIKTVGCTPNARIEDDWSAMCNVIRYGGEPMRDDNENSVMKALSEVARLEDQRVADETRRTAEARAEARAEAERKREEAERLAAAAEQERARRKKLERELASRDEVARTRMMSLKAELQAVQADREAMRRAVMSRYESLPAPAPAPARTVPLSVVVAGIGVMMAGFVGAVQLWPKAEPPKVEAVPQGTEPSLNMNVDGYLKSKITRSYTETSEKQDDPIESAAAVPEPDNPPSGGTVRKPGSRGGKGAGKRGGKRGGKQGRGGTKQGESNIIDTFSACGDDPMCGHGLFLDSK